MNYDQQIVQYVTDKQTIVKKALKQYILTPVHTIFDRIVKCTCRIVVCGGGVESTKVQRVSKCERSPLVFDTVTVTLDRFN